MDLHAILIGIRTLVSVHRWTKKFVYFWNYTIYKPAKILIIGVSGSGKTQFLNSFLGIPMLQDNRTYVPDNKYFIFDNGRKIQFIDLPGHTTLQGARQKYIDEITKNKIKGIINVVNYGYNDAEQNNADVFKTGENEVKPAYLIDNRKSELSQLKEWLNRIHGESKPDWIITIVNKADIWYNQKDEVMDYYENGDYGDEFKEIKRVTNHFVFKYCSVINPFGGRPMTLIMSELEKNEMQKHLKESLLRLIQGKNEAE